jgi:hypothetical protein
MSKDKEESAGVGNAALFGELKKKKGKITYFILLKFYQKLCLKLNSFKKFLGFPEIFKKHFHLMIYENDFSMILFLNSD